MQSLKMVSNVLLLSLRFPDPLMEFEGEKQVMELFLTFQKI